MLPLVRPRRSGGLAARRDGPNRPAAPRVPPARGRALRTASPETRRRSTAPRTGKIGSRHGPQGEHHAAPIRAARCCRARPAGAPGSRRDTDAGAQPVARDERDLRLTRARRHAVRRRRQLPPPDPERLPAPLRRVRTPVSGGRDERGARGAAGVHAPRLHRHRRAVPEDVRLASEGDRGGLCRRLPDRPRVPRDRAERPPAPQHEVERVRPDLGHRPDRPSARIPAGSGAVPGRRRRLPARSRRRHPRRPADRRAARLHRRLLERRRHVRPRRRRGVGRLRRGGLQRRRTRRHPSDHARPPARRRSCSPSATATKAWSPPWRSSTRA